MNEMLRIDEPAFCVTLTDGQRVKTVETPPEAGVFDSARKIIGCQMITIVEPEILQKRNCVMLIDENAKLRDGDLYVNCVASYLYRTHQHGDAIVGNAVIVKRSDDDVVMLTASEAESLSQELSQMRSHAINTISKALRIPPMPAPKESSISSALHPQKHNRQPCKDAGMER